MRKVLFVAILLWAAIACGAENLEGKDFLNGLKGTYIELFSNEGCSNPKLDDVWLSAAEKCVGKSDAKEAVKMLKNSCGGTVIGEEAVEFYRNSKTMQFCCSFMHDIAKFVFDGNSISGIGKDGAVVFAHKYHLVSVDKETGDYLYESEDENSGDFTYFWMRPDSPSATFHIEFRYGNDKSQLPCLMLGKYAYWMASGVRENNDMEIRSSIKLFVEENLSK